MATPLPQLDITSTLGITLIGQALSCIGLTVIRSLFGVTCIQTYHYFRSSGTDPLLIKIVPSLLPQNALTPIFRLKGNWGRDYTKFIAFIVESFLVVRIWLLFFMNPWLIQQQGTLTVAHLVMNLVFPIKTARTPFSRTNDMVSKLIGLTVTTGLLTTYAIKTPCRGVKTGGMRATLSNSPSGRLNRPPRRQLISLSGDRALHEYKLRIELGHGIGAIRELQEDCGLKR
ncbi:hypothetical protein C8J57DRAFT_1223569 [Mycena rebaudengoi]|nr:hypothetical protein C8J57DRAFT_1223569 [Mycena rebaudengoi]